MIQHFRSQIKTRTFVCTLTISMFALAMFLLVHSNYAMVSFFPNAFAVNDTGSLGSLAETVDLGAPFYIQYYSHNVSAPDSESEPNLYVNHTNVGMIDGSLSVSHIGNTTETLRDNNTVYLQGFRNLTADNEMGTAFYEFQAIGNYGPQGNYESRGVAIFDEAATGNLSFLANTVAVYKTSVDADGNGAFLMWHWR
ncbi:hypothetical protein YTPLAS21_21110 [Candidatus Nitrosocosmicus sp.]|nr:hypothetical protein YTPLAS21_21110 [Candidatus Nitrosocosmicus sp.]